MISATGEAELRRFGSAMRVASAEVHPAAMRGVRGSVETFRPSLAREGAEALPAGGGLRGRVGGYPVDVTSTPESVSVRMDGVAGYDDGRILHPVFGNRDVWVSQPSESKGNFTKVLERRAREVVPHAGAAIQVTLHDVARKV